MTAKTESSAAKEKEHLKEHVVEMKTAAEHDDRLSKAREVIHRNVLWSLGAGALPLPVIDLVAVTGVQIKMLKEIADLYEIKFSQGVVKKLVFSLFSSLGGVGIGTLLGSLVKAIPVVGTTLGVVSTPIIVGAFTHATGQVFLMHFESGGTLLDFKPEAMRSYFKAEFEKAKELVAKLQTEAKSTDSTAKAV